MSDKKLLDRVAASECVRLIALLLEAETPHAKELGLIVIVRLKAILQDDARGEPLPMEELEPWLHVVTDEATS